VAEDPRQRLLGGALGLRHLEGLPHLAEDLALAQDQRVDAGGHPEEVAHGRLVVIAVEMVDEGVGGDARVLGEELAHVGNSGVELGAVGVDLGAVAGGEQGHLGQVLAAGQVEESLGQFGR
jgi:hypothetical protein